VGPHGAQCEQRSYHTQVLEITPQMGSAVRISDVLARALAGH
jgi:hypothetical protein